MVYYQRTTQEEDVIIELYSKFKTLSEVSRQVGLSIATVGSILNRRGISYRGVGEAQTGIYRNTEEKFWNKAIKNPNGCWEWQKSLNRDGYGAWVYQGKKVWVHRQAWVFSHGEIPEGMHVLHKCDNPSCINPDHLFLGTHQDNMTDRNNKGRAIGGSAKGTKNARARFTESDILQMRKMYEQGLTQKKIGEYFNTYQAVVSSIVRRKYWTHI